MPDTFTQTIPEGPDKEIDRDKYTKCKTDVDVEALNHQE